MNVEYHSVVKLVGKTPVDLSSVAQVQPVGHFSKCLK